MRRIAKLPEDDSGPAFDPNHLAGCLTTLASRLHDVHRMEEAVETAQEGVRLHRQVYNESPEESGNSLPAALSNLSVYLSEVPGREEEALEVVEEAVMITRGLPAAERTEILAQVLGAHASRLSELGRGSEATEVIQEAIDLTRHRQSEEPNEFTPKLAASLLSYSHRLSESGDIEKSIEAAQESTALFRKLAEDRPGEYSQYFAGSLNNLGAQLSKLDRDAEALIHFEEALTVNKRLAAEFPAAFNGSMARSMHNFAASLTDLDRYPEAWEIIQQAVQMFRSLAADHPAAYNDDLALALRLAACCLQHLQRREEALLLIQESVEMWRKLAEERPAAFTRGLIASLLILSECLEQTGHEAESFQVKVEVVNTFESDDTLRKGGSISREAMKKAMDEAAEEMQKEYGADANDAIRAARQALEELKDMDTSRGDFMAEIEKKLGIDPEAFQRYKETGGFSKPKTESQEKGHRGPSTSDPVDRRLMEAALKKFEQEHGADTNGLLDLMRDTMNNFGSGTMTLDSLFEAVAQKAGVPSFAHLRQQRSRTNRSANAQAGPSKAGSSTQTPPIIEVTDSDCAEIFADARHDVSATYLTNLSTELSGSGHHAEAVDAIQEAVTTNRRLAVDQPAAYNPDLSASLHMLSSRLLALGRQDDALKAIQEAITIRRKLAADHPQIFGSALEESLRVLNQCRLMADRERRPRSKTPEARNRRRDEPMPTPDPPAPQNGGNPSAVSKARKRTYDEPVPVPEPLPPPKRGDPSTAPKARKRTYDEPLPMPVPILALVRSPSAAARIVEVAEMAIQTDEPDCVPDSQSGPTIEAPLATPVPRYHTTHCPRTLSDAGSIGARDDDAHSDISHPTSRRISRTATPVDDEPITISIVPPAQSNEQQERCTPITADNLQRLSSQISNDPDAHTMHELHTSPTVVSARMTGYLPRNTTPSHDEQGLKAQAEMHAALLKSIENQEKLLAMMKDTFAAGAGLHQASPISTHSAPGATKLDQYRWLPSDVYGHLIVAYLATLGALLVAFLLPLSLLGLLFYKL